MWSCDLAHGTGRKAASAERQPGSFLSWLTTMDSGRCLPELGKSFPGGNQVERRLESWQGFPEGAGDGAGRQAQAFPHVCLQGPSPSLVSTATSAHGTRRTCACTCGADTQAASRNGGGAILRSPRLAAAPSSLCSRLRS